MFISFIMELFKETVKEGDHLVYFGANWCSSCRTIKNSVSILTYKNTHIFDIEEDEDVTALCVVTKLPTIQVWKNGEEVEKYEGERDCNIAIIIARHFTEYTDDIVEEEFF